MFKELKEKMMYLVNKRVAKLQRAVEIHRNLTIEKKNNRKKNL